MAIRFLPRRTLLICLAGLSLIGFIVVLFYFLFPAEAKPRSYYWNEKLDHFRFLETPSCDVALYGDSLIDNGEWAEMLYPLVVVNRGVQGFGVSNVLEYASGSNLNCDVAIVHVGINDIRRGEPYKAIADYYDDLIAILRSNHDVILVTSIFHFNVLTHSAHDKLERVNAYLYGLAIEFEDVIFVDLGSEFATGKDLSLDGIHLTGRGYAVWREQVRQHICDSELKLGRLCGL